MKGSRGSFILDARVPKEKKMLRRKIVFEKGGKVWRLVFCGWEPEYWDVGKSGFASGIGKLIYN